MRVALKRLLLLLTLSITLLAMPASVLAASGSPCALEDRRFGIPTWYKYLQGEREFDTNNDNSTDDERCVPVLDLQDNAQAAIIAILLAVFDILIFVAGLIAVVFVVVGAVQFITSQGEPDKVKNARTTIMNALIGLVIVMVSTVAVNLIGNTLT